MNTCELTQSKSHYIYLTLYVQVTNVKLFYLMCPDIYYNFKKTFTLAISFWTGQFCGPSIKSICQYLRVVQICNFITFVPFVFSEEPQSEWCAISSPSLLGLPWAELTDAEGRSCFVFPCFLQLVVLISRGQVSTGDVFELGGLPSSLQSSWKRWPVQLLSGCISAEAQLQATLCKKLVTDRCAPTSLCF